MVWAGAAFSQNAVAPEPRNIIQLSATGTVEVEQDLLMIQLATTKEDSSAAAVQLQLKNALDTALAEAKRNAKPGQMDVRTGPFGLQPRYGKEGKITAWRGSASLILEGRDFERITATAGRVQTLSISHVSFGLSREARSQVEGEAQKQAIEQFKARASDVAQHWGFSNYSLREVSINSNDMSPGLRMRPMAMQAKSSLSAEDAVPVEAGKAQVQVNVSGSVQLR